MPVITTALAALGTALGTGAAAAGTAAATTAATTAAAAGSVGSIAATVGTLGTLGAVVGTGVQLYEGQKMAAAQREQEAIRKKASEFEFARARREVIRQTQIARATGLNSAAQSGGEIQGSDILGGINGQYANNQAYQLNSINQNQQLSDANFASNATESSAAGMASLFGGVAKLGGVLTDNNMQLGRIGATLAGNGASLFNA